MTELFITGLPFAATEETIVEFFSDDQCTSVELQRYEDGRSKGRAFVRFEDEDTAQKVFDGRKEMEMEGRKLFIDFTGSKSVFGCKLFVKGLPWGATEEEVAALECFAGVESVEILKFEDGKSKGVGFLKFGTFEDAEAAFNRRMEAEMDDRRLWLDFTGPRSRFKNGSRGRGRGRGRGGFRGRGRGGFNKNFNDENGHNNENRSENYVNSGAGDV